MWLLIPILIYSLVYLYVRHVYSYWDRKGFPSERSGLSWRFLKQVYRREFHYVDAVNEAYNAGREQCLGIYFLFRPTLLVRNLELARTMLEQSNVHFNNTKWDYIKGYRKFNLMEKLAPIFTLSRCEGMLRNIEKVADYMLQHLDAITLERETICVDLQRILRLYAANLMGNMVYGLDSNSFEQSDCIFANYLSGSATNSFTLSHLPKKSSLAYRLRDILRESVERREEGSIIRKDVLQLLVKIRNGNEIGNAAKQVWHIDNVFEREKLLSIKKLSKMAEAILHMGLNSIAATAVLTFYEVLQAPVILQRVIGELQHMNGQFTWEGLEQLKYLELCVQETLRKYPPVPIIERVCRKNYNIPGSKYTVSAGKAIMVPLLALQRDGQYFEAPEEYRPERFSSNKATFANEGFIGYGLGAGSCVAQNFSKLVIKVAIVKLLEQFQLELIPDQNLELDYNPMPYIKSRQGFKVKLKRRLIKPNFYL